MENPPIQEKQQIVDKIKAVTNILVTVSRDPSVDDLSAALGLTLLLNKIGKHATAIFSGAIPPAITFLEPNKVFENTVDSLRDFIIALDKEKADHLRYKVDGDVVKIFITPYRTIITDKDLEFSQGDYNVELVLALGVENQDHLDTALAAHGQILHDVPVFSVSSASTSSRLGSVNWSNPASSSLCEMITSLSDSLKSENPILDKQISTALLTGIVAATDRFSNAKTTSSVMALAAELMAAGADQQLIAAKLQDAHQINALTVSPAVPVTEPLEPVPAVADTSKLPANSLSISHDEPSPEPDIATVAPTPEIKQPEASIIATSTLPESNEPKIILDSKLDISSEPKVEQPAVEKIDDVIQSTLPTAPNENLAATEFDNLDHPYLAETVSTAAPINGSMQADDDKRLIDIFNGDLDNDPNSNSTLPPTTTDLVLPVPADFSSRDVDDTKDAVASILGTQPEPQSTLPPLPDQTVSVPTPAPMPNLPLPPQLPDFSTTVPPLVPNFNVPVSSEPVGQVPDDPTQFRIPGQ
jgi:hypothetical protein